MLTGATKLNKQDVLFLLSVKEQVANVKLVLGEEMEK